MLSVKSISSGGGAGSAARYYDGLAKEDYYTHGGEPPGVWYGQHAERLGLDGQIREGELGRALEGYHPHTGEALAENAGADHKPGWDCTFSAPKSVSMAWAAGSDSMRAEISQMQREAVQEAISMAEREAFHTRTGHAGAEWVPHQDGVAAALFEHSTSREGEAQLHTHAVISNLTEDGKRLDFDSRWKMSLGAAYRTALADRLQQRGFVIERDGKSFRVRDIPKDLEKEQSTRREQIKEALAEKGLRGGKAAAVAALDTRREKGEVNRSELVQQTREIAAAHGVTPEKIDAMAQPGTVEKEPMLTQAEMLSEMTREASTVSEQQLHALVLQEAQGKLNLVDAQSYLQDLKQNPELIALQDAKGNIRYTSQEMYQLEKRIGEQSRAMAVDKQSHNVPERHLQAAMASRTLSDEQAKALAHITQPGRFALVEGTAGAGKSYMLDAARDAWQRAGYNVHGCALAGKAAEGLEKSSGIQSATIHSTLNKLESGALKLDSKSVMVVDEGGMVGSRLMAELQNYVDAAGGKLVIVGDTRQLQPIDAGGAMRAQRESVGEFAAMNEIRRQNDDAEKAMVLQAKAGEFGNVMQHLDERGRILQHQDRQAVAKAMADGVVKDMQAGKTSIAMAETRAAVRQINEEARAAAKAAGLVTGPEAKFQTEDRQELFAQGDRIIFMKNDRQLGVKNGTTGTVEKAEDGKLVVRLDDSAQKSPDGKPIPGTERQVMVDAGAYNEVRHGYAMTVHKSQGVTVDRAHYSPGGMTHAELAYVALSRHRETVHLHITPEQMKDLAGAMSESRAKGTSQDYSLYQPKEQNHVTYHPDDRIRAAQHAVAVSQSNTGEDRRAGPAESLASVRDLSRCDLVRDAARAEMHVQDHASHHVDRERGARGDMRRQGTGPDAPRAGTGRYEQLTRQIERDASLAGKALESYRRGDKAPPTGKALDKAIKTGEIRPTKDSSGRVYYQHRDGRVQARDLYREVRQTHSRNLNHALLTKTRYMKVDKTFAGIKYGSQILKSGGTLKSELAGKLRDQLKNKDSALGKALQKGENWQKAGTLESMVARGKMALQQRSERAQTVKDLEKQAAAPDRIKQEIQAARQQEQRQRQEWHADKQEPKRSERQQPEKQEQKQERQQPERDQKQPEKQETKQPERQETRQQEKAQPERQDAGKQPDKQEQRQQPERQEVRQADQKQPERQQPEKQPERQEVRQAEKQEPKRSERQQPEQPEKQAQKQERQPEREGQRQEPKQQPEKQEQRQPERRQPEKQSERQPADKQEQRQQPERQEQRQEPKQPERQEVRQPDRENRHERQQDAGKQPDRDRQPDRQPEQIRDPGREASEIARSLRDATPQTPEISRNHGPEQKTPGHESEASKENAKAKDGKESAREAGEIAKSLKEAKAPERQQQEKQQERQQAEKQPTPERDHGDRGR